MSDEPQGQINPEGMSTSEPIIEVDEEKEALENSKNPERTAAYIQKLKDQNKALAEKARESQPHKQSVLEELYPEASTPNLQPQTTFQVGNFDNLNKKQVQDIQEEFTYTGEDGYKYIDPTKLNQALKDANDRAERAVKSAQIASDSVRRYEETQQVRDTYSVFPQLNPNHENYDPNFYEMVKGELMNQAMKGEKNLLKAAKSVDQRLNVYRGGASKQVAAEKTQVQKQQINATTNTYRGAQSSADIDELVQGTMMGKPGALAERLRRSGY